MFRRLFTALPVLLLTAAPVAAQAISGGMALNAANATLPDARNNLGIATFPIAGLVGDATKLTCGATTAASAALTASCASFTSADAGKPIVVEGAGAAGASLATTILSVTDATHVTLAAAASSTVPRYTAQSATVAAAGSGYVAGDTITLAGGTGTAAVITVLSVDTGGVKYAYPSTVGSYSVLPSDPVAQASTSGVGTGATFTMTPWTATGTFVYGTDNAAAINAALTGLTAGGCAVVPAGNYGVASAVELPTLSSGPAAGLCGAGMDSSTIYALATMTNLVHRGSTFGFGGGVLDITLDSIKVATHTLYIEGATHGFFTRVSAKNAVTAECRLGNGSTQLYETDFVENWCYTEQAYFPPTLRSTYNLWLHSVTDSNIKNNTLYNASGSNLYDQTSGSNRIISNHTYGFPIVSYFPQYGLRTVGKSTLIGNELDGATTAQLFIDKGSNTYADSVIALGNICLFLDNSVLSAKCALIDTGTKNTVVSGIVQNLNWPVPAAQIVSITGTPDPSLIVYGNPGASTATAPNPGTGTHSAVLNDPSSTATAFQAVAGAGGSAGGTACLGFGPGSGCTGIYSRVHGQQSTDMGLPLLDVFGGSYLGTQGDKQKVVTLLAASTTSTTPTRLTADNGAAGATNCLNLPNNSAISITSASLVGKDTTSAGNAYSAFWNNGLLDRGANAASTAYSGPSSPNVSQSRGTGSTTAVAIAADTTNGCLSVTITSPNTNTWKWVYELRGTMTRQ